MQSIPELNKLFLMASIRSTVPMLPARHMPATVEFYRILGFEPLYLFKEEYAIVHRDGCELHLFAFPDLDPHVTPFSVYVRIENADRLYEEFHSRGVGHLSTPETKPWGQRELTVIDPNYTLLRFGQTITPNY